MLSPFLFHNRIALQDWQQKHELDRKAIQELVCALCDTRQPVTASCTACGVDFGALLHSRLSHAMLSLC